MPLETETRLAEARETCRDAVATSRDPLVTEADRTQGSKWEAAIVLAVGIVFSLGVIFEVSPLNGLVRLTGWEWAWRNDIELLRVMAFLFVPYALIEFVLRKEDKNGGSGVWISVAALTLANFLLQIMGKQAEPLGFGRLQRIVQSPTATSYWDTSYFTDAQKIDGVAAWLRSFDHASLAFHSSTHPPGPVLFYYIFVKWFGVASGALIGGVALGFLGSLGVAVAYVFAGLWTNDRRTRLIAGAFYALLPALTVFFTEFDEAYPIFAMLLIFFWCRSLQSEEKVSWNAACAGVILFAALLFAYNLITVAAFLAYYALYSMWRQGWSGAAFGKVLRNAAVAITVWTGAQVILRASTGFDPVSSFRQALAYQKVYATLLHRAYLTFIFCDPYDLLLGAGILALPLVVAYLYRVARSFDFRRQEVGLSILGLATILTVDLSGVLRGEAARVWLFLQPLLLMPAALELSRFRGRWRASLFTMQWMILVCLKAKMLFL